MKSKIKVMHFVSGFRNGGVEQVLLNYTGLVNKNYDIDEVIVYQHKANPKKLKLSQELGNRMYEIPFKKEHPLKNIVATYKLIKKEKPDIVHAHMNLVNFFPLLIAKILGVRGRISHSHIAHDNINPKLVPIFKKLNIISSTNLMACGQSAGNYMYGRKIFTILYNAIDQSKYRYNPKYRKEIRQIYDLSNNTVVLGSIGRNVEQKNQKFLIDIFSDYLKLNNNSVLMLIGDGPLSSDLDNYIKQKGCSNKIIRVKSTLSTEKYYSAFDIFLLPSLYEGLPVVSIEAQANGLVNLLTDSIDKTVDYTGKVRFLSIKDGTRVWVKNIANSLHENQRKEFNEDNNYNIKMHYKDLYSYYVQILRK